MTRPETKNKKARFDLKRQKGKRKSFSFDFFQYDRIDNKGHVALRPAILNGRPQDSHSANTGLVCLENVPPLIAHFH